MDIAQSDMEALIWSLGAAEADAWLERISDRLDRDEVLAYEIARCKAMQQIINDPRPREERDRDLLPQPTQRDIELAKARMYVEQQMMLNAARTLGLREAETYLTAELAKMEQ